MQDLRNIKFKDYPFWRFDKSNLQIINGGWHFSFLQTPENIIKKIKAYSHGEFNTSMLTNQNKIEQKILRNEDIFDRKFDLKKIEIDRKFPDYIFNNKNLLKKWII